jgi:hypothetical protein
MTEVTVDTTPNLPAPYYNLAKKVVAEARTIDDVKDIRDKGMAMRVYTEQAKDSRLEKDAIFIRLRAERRMGEMLREGEDNRAPVGRPWPEDNG